MAGARRWCLALVVTLAAAGCGGGSSGTESSAGSSDSTLSRSSTSSSGARTEDDRTFVAPVDGSTAAIAFVVSDRKIAAYLCDGDHIGETFEVDLSGGAFAGESNGVQLEGSVLGDKLSGTVVFDGAEHEFRTAPTEGAAGWYRSVDATIDGQETQAGWVVLNDGTQVGTVRIAGQAQPAAPLEAGASTHGTTVFRPALVRSVARTQPAGVLISGDGEVDAGGSATTSLLSGVARKTNWTKPGTDDSFVVIDATQFRNLGIGNITDTKGVDVEGEVLAKDGLLVKLGESTIVPGSGWSLLQSLDADGDGALTPADPGFGPLKRFTDANADGKAEPAEVQAFGDTVSSLPLGLGIEKKDPFGNLQASASWVDLAGVTKKAAAIRLITL